MQIEQKARIVMRMLFAFVVVCLYAVYFVLGVHSAVVLACLIAASIVWGVMFVRENMRAHAVGGRMGFGVGASAGASANAGPYGVARESASEEAERARRNPNSVLRGAGNHS